MLVARITIYPQTSLPQASQCQQASLCQPSPMPPKARPPWLPDACVFLAPNYTRQWQTMSMKLRRCASARVQRQAGMAKYTRHPSAPPRLTRPGVVYREIVQRRMTFIGDSDGNVTREHLTGQPAIISISPELHVNEELDLSTAEHCWELYEWCSRKWLWNANTAEWFYCDEPPSSWRRFKYFHSDQEKFYWWCSGDRWFPEP